MIDPCHANLQMLGFAPTTYPGQDGVFYSADVHVKYMPGLSQQVDEEFVFHDSVATVEILTDGLVQLSINETSYHEGPVDAQSEGGQRLLADVIAAIAAGGRVNHHAAT